MSQELSDESSSFLKLRWRTIAIATTLVMLSLFITLIIVAARIGADALSTTALALAILAFGAQWIVYIAQVSDATDSRRQASEINGATQVSLARIGTTVTSSEQILRDQGRTRLEMRELLTEARQKGIEAKESASPLTVSGVLELIEAKAEEYGSRSDLREAGAHEGIDDNDGDDDTDSWGWQQSIFDFWPEEDAAKSAHKTLQSLDPISIGQLVRFGEEQKTSEALGLVPGMIVRGPETSPFSQCLIDVGLVEFTQRYPSGRPPKEARRPTFAVLTDAGVVAARLVMAKGFAPDYVRNLI